MYDSARTERLSRESSPPQLESVTTPRSLERVESVSIRTAALEAVVSAAGPVTTRRTDLLLSGQSGQGMHHPPQPYESLVDRMH